MTLTRLEVPQKKRVRAAANVARVILDAVPAANAKQRSLPISDRARVGNTSINAHQRQPLSYMLAAHATCSRERSTSNRDIVWAIRAQF